MRNRNWMPAVCGWMALMFLLGIAVSQQPASYESLLASAQQAQASGDFSAAAGYYQQASMLHPEIAELKANLGLMYYQSNHNEQAAEAFQQALRLNPALFVANLFLGLDDVKLKRFSEAVLYLKRAVRLKPGDIHAQTGLAQAYAGLGQTRLAAQSYLTVARMKPGDADVWYRLGLCYLEQVEADARILLARYNDSGFVQALKAENFAEQGVLNRAAASYRKALSLAAFPPGTHAQYAFVLLNEHDLPGAERELKSELASNPGSLLAKLGIARLEVEQGSADKGAKQIAQIWNADPGFLAANVRRFESGLAPAKMTDLQAALKSLEPAGELPEEAVSLFKHGAAEALPSPVRQTVSAPLKAAVRVQLTAAHLYSQGAYRRCADVLAPQMPTLSTTDLRLLALCASATGDFDLAFDAGGKLSNSASTAAEGLYWETKASEELASQALSRASRIDSASPQLHVLLGDVYRQQERFDNAEQEYHKALTLRPQDGGALFGLSLALLGDGKNDEALQVAQTALKSDPNDPEFNAVMGEVLCRRNDFTGAETYLKRSLNAKPEYIAHVHGLLGKVYANTNRTQEAIAELKLALPEDKDGHIYYQIGRLYMTIGDRESAQQAFVASKRLAREGLSKSDTRDDPEQAERDSQ